MLINYGYLKQENILLLNFCYQDYTYSVSLRLRRYKEFIIMRLTVKNELKLILTFKRLTLYLVRNLLSLVGNLGILVWDLWYLVRNLWDLVRHLWRLVRHLWDLVRHLWDLIWDLLSLIAHLASVLGHEGTDHNSKKFHFWIFFIFKMLSCMWDFWSDFLKMWFYFYSQKSRGVGTFEGGARERYFFLGYLPSERFEWLIRRLTRKKPLRPRVYK